MLKKRTHTLWIFTGTIIFLVLIVYTAVKIYDIALEETKRNHQILQKEMADATTAGIVYYLDRLAEDLHLLASFPCMQNFEKQSLYLHVNYFFRHAELHGVKAIFVADLETNIVYSTTDTLPQWVNPLLIRQMQWARKTENHQKSWYSAVYPEDIENSEGELLFLVLVPIIQYSQNSLHSLSINKPVGLVGKVVSFSRIVQQYVAPVNLGTSGAAWVMDSRGRLLFHPEHPEMILRDISKNSPDCISCHPSFEIQNRMIAEEAAYGEYTVGEEPTKIMSHVPIEIQDERWILVITTYLSEVASILRDKFTLFFILIGIIICAILIAGLLFYLVNTRRIRAEEAHRHIEHKEQLQQQINNAAKLASIGELVDSVAHEINTPTGIIMAQAEAMLLQKMADNNYAEELGIIKEQTWRISEYTRSLLDYSQRMPFQLEQIDLTDLLNKCLYLLGHRFRAQKIVITKNFTKHLPQTFVDHRQIEQVFINLLNNAIDAIDGAGEIKIGICLLHGNSERGFEISITDNGEGISREALSQIFKPFFSTKLPDRGTGLGLSITKAIIQRHNGKISVTSTEGKGTTFVIFLPVNDNNR